MTEKYRQCSLRRIESNSIVYTTSYIPDKFAIKGKVLKLKDDNDKWVDGWVVHIVGQLTDEPLDSHNAIKSHRKATGDSLPKKPN